jgi:glycine/D-amino acid oxidase-like deaminating enzyme
MTAGYADTSFWLESCDDDLTPRDPLDGSRDADVAILGAGFTGLWTAYYLLRAQPELRVVLLESEIAGFGASGRNGGWCTSGFGAGPDQLAARFGVDAARAVHDAMIDTVDEVGRVCVDEGIDAHYQRDGELLVAIGDHQVPALDAIERTYQRIGGDDFHCRLSADETRERIAIDGARGALFHPATASVHPARLVRGLAGAVERRGGVICESTPVTAFAGGPSPYLDTARGRVSAPVVVLAGEAYLSQLPALRRAVLPIYSYIVLTVDYLSRTADGRILFGGRGAPYHFGSSIAPEHDRSEPTFARLRQSLVEWFPSLEGVGFTHAWGGCLGVPRDFIPIMRFDRASGVATARGYTGEGVAASNLSGRVLADLISGADSSLVALPMTSHHGRNWEVEPFRFLATRLAERGAMRIDERGARTGASPTGRTLTERLISH